MHIHFVAGGFHLVVAQDPAIEKVATTLHDTYKVDYIAPRSLQRKYGSHRLSSCLERRSVSVDEPIGA
jgi:metal-dependent hydrolase (beta-lactamase superfamily II)